MVSNNKTNNNDDEEKSRIINFHCAGCRTYWSEKAINCKKIIYPTELWYYNPCPRCRIKAATRWV